MSVTVDCGENKHTICCGSGHTAYLFPQESVPLDEPAFSCGCWCHHREGGPGVPCRECPAESVGGL